MYDLNLKKFKDAPEVLKNTVGLLSLIAIIIFTFFILNIYFGPGEKSIVINPVSEAETITEADQKIISGTLSNIRAKVRSSKITRTSLIMVGKVFSNNDFIDSRLYSKDHKHVLRPK